MADAVVSFLVQRLHDLLIQEASLLQGVRDEVNWLKNELTRMQCFLKDADRRVDTVDMVRNWESEIRNIAYDIEDTVDTFMVETAAEKRGFAASVKKYACIFKNGASLHYIGKDIESLKKRILDIYRSAESYGIKIIGNTGEGTSGLNERLKQLRRTTSSPDKELVGFEDDRKLLLKQLLKEERQRCVISILGMGGLGKTTLARKLFNSNDVKGSFDCYAWICVSQEYTTRDLLQRLIKSFEKPTKELLKKLERMNEEDLEVHLYNFLANKRYLVVMDDVWHKEDWEILSKAFPDSGNRSRVIITTRNKAVAVITDEKSYVHNLRFLTREESWRLFCTKAFPYSANNMRSRCPQGLESLGREMVDKCDGLPLAIIVLCGLLSRKQPLEWRMVKDQMWRHLTRDSVHVSSILALSYNELPYQLKACFLYLGLFPEDFVIDAEKLIHLWVAEGFIPQNEGVMEDVAEEYLEELVDRSLIQTVERNLERTKACRIHDLLRDLAVMKAREQSFLDVYNGNTNSSSSPTSCRREATHSAITRYVSSDHSNPSLRSLLFFKSDHESLKADQFKFIYSRFKLLRVLNLEDTRIQLCSLSRTVVTLPDAMGKLIHLRYLGFKSINTVEFPSSICNLRSLQTLVVNGNSMCKLPAGICELNQLRHLIARTHRFRPVKTLPNLLTLKYVTFDEWKKINTVNLINLRELEIRKTYMVDMQTFSLEPIARIESLQSLTLQTKNIFPPLLPLSHCRHLIKLKLDGKLENLPRDVNEFPPNLTILMLQNLELKHDPMPVLGKLPNLAVLDFGNDSYLGEEMVFSAQGFPQLQVLRLSWLRNLKWLNVEEEAMPRLRNFSIEDCRNLQEVPERLMMLPILQEC